MKKYIVLVLIIITFAGHETLLAQEAYPDYKQLMDNLENTTFLEIQEKAETYFADKEKGRGSGYKQWKRWEYLTQRRLTPDGKVANAAAMNLKAYQEYMATMAPEEKGSDEVKATNGFWDFIGPTNYITGSGWNGGVGRVNSIAFHPTNSSIFYIGTPAGGLWKTSNGGSTWTCLTDGMPSIGVSGIVVHPSNPNIIYILTGDGDSEDTFCTGVMKTTDGGGYWFYTGLEWGIEDFVRGYKLAMHPTLTNVLFAATSDGIYKTTNSGSSWTQVQTGYFHDLEFKPGDPAIMYATAETLFYRSTDTGDTWTTNNSDAGVPVNASRIAIGVSPFNPAYVYLLCGPAVGWGQFRGVYRSFDSGLNFDLKADTPNLLGYSSTGQDSESQSTYDLAIAVSRTDVADVIIGGINTWASYNYGGTWSIKSWWTTAANTIGYTHADIHALEINPLNNWLYVGSDGGIFRSLDFGNSWTDLTSGLGNTQWYRIAGTEADVDHIIGGTQDNGSNRFEGSNTMIHMVGADGMDAMIDHNNSLILYTTRQNGTLEKSTNAGASFSNITPPGVLGEWVTPLVMSKTNSNLIYGGYSTVMKSTDGGSSWTAMFGADGRGAIAMGTNNAARVYASSVNFLNSTSVIKMSNDAGENWTSVNGTLPSQIITFIAVNPDYSPDVFVTFGGYSAGQKVYYSNNAGTTWTNISGSLPNVPIHCIAYEDKNGSPNDALYIGTDIGIFYRDDNTGDWIPFMNGLPTVPVFDLEINYGSGVITAATYGRGLWRSSLFTSCPVAYGLTPANDPSNPNYTGYQFYEAGTSINSTRTITGGEGTDVIYKAGTRVELLQGFHAKSGNKFKAILGPCDAAKSQDGTTIEQEYPEDKPDIK